MEGNEAGAAIAYPAGHTAAWSSTGRTWLLVLAAVMLFIAVTSFRLDRTGLYYDELHQAVGAFAWVGRPTTMFSVLPINSKPVFNMPYSGAIKTTVYGLYMKLSGRPFSIVEWRLAGILFGAGGIAAFLLLTAGQLNLATQSIFLALLLTDMNLLLQVRHDWGPVALGFLFRMLFLGFWVRWRNALGAARSFILGLVVGVAIFEKLSSAVLLAPLALLLSIGDGAPRSRRFIGAVTGVVVGSLPVVVANVYWLIAHNGLLGLSNTSAEWQSVRDYAFSYIAVGNGEAQRLSMFTSRSFWWTEPLEALAITTLLVVVGIRAWRRRHESNDAAIGACALCYIAVGVALRCLPAGTTENHWIIGTPFHYLAVAFVVAPGAETLRTSRAQRLVYALVIVLFIARAPVLFQAFDSIQHERYTPPWDPSENVAAEFVARQDPGSVFLAADWGVATQAFSLSNGRQDFVFEPFWDYQGAASLQAILAGPERRMAIVSAPRPRSPVNPAATARIFRDMAQMDGWGEVPLPSTIRQLSAVELHAYRRAPVEARR